MKVVRSVALALFLFNALLLCWHYTGHKAVNSAGFYQTEAELEIRGSALRVVQHFRELPPGELKIVWPTGSRKRACEPELPGGCKRFAASGRTLKPGKESAQSISYEMALGGAAPSSDMLKGVLAKLEGPAVEATIIHLSDYSKRGGLWLTGLPLIEHKRLKGLEYRLFYGRGEASELYFQRRALPVAMQTPLATVYAPKAIGKEMRSKIEALNIKGALPIDIVAGAPRAGDAQRIALLATADGDQLDAEVAAAAVRSLYSFPTDSKPLQEFVASSLTGGVRGGEKAQKMLTAFRAYATDRQRAHWNAELKEMRGQALTGRALDRLFCRIANVNTSFFQKNARASGAFYPLVFEDGRPIWVDDHKRSDMEAILKDGRILYPLRPALQALGYRLRMGEGSLYIDGRTHSMRFPLHHPFYVVDDRRYDALADPFEVIGGTYYVEESSLIRLFRVDVQKEEDRIAVLPLGET